MKYLMIVFSLALIAMPVAAQQSSNPAISVTNPMIRAVSSGAKVAAGFMTLNTTGEGDMLMGASSPLAEQVEIHESVTEGGIARMRPVSALALDSGKELSFQPGGLHLMLNGLKAPLVEGEQIPVTLLFNKAGPVDVKFKIMTIGRAKEHQH